MTDPARAVALEAFLAGLGWADAERLPLPADASFRRYVRLRKAGGTAMLMDAPPPMEDVRPYVAIARHLLALGLSAPRLDGVDVERGFVLLEDFGDDTYTRLLARGHDEAALYRLAAETLCALHAHPDAAAIDLPPYDAGRFIAEAMLLADWYLPAVTGAAPSAAQRATWAEAWEAVLPEALDVPRSLVLRDYHVDNLMLLPGRSGVAACGLLDFQDALIGPVTYDHASLVEDARRDVPPAVAAMVGDIFFGAHPPAVREALRRSSAILAAQRHAKVIGIFTRLAHRDGKPGYLRHLPRLWRLLESHLDGLPPVRRWLDAHLPRDVRRIPESRAA